MGDPPRPAWVRVAVAAAVSGSPRARSLARLGVLSPPAAEETDRAGARRRRRGSQPGESADPAHPARHPTETSSGARGAAPARAPPEATPASSPQRRREASGSEETEVKSKMERR
ncbi:uncharacterized protein LOC118238768 [Cricetulus griseus]|uniref:Uncharacterized protein LOC118238768 n=1 Tax=Cricetulus griseus TaxID=10029 RepID=A0A9J7GYJ6_CRIGR|nr:uncharacterized protein LOC118238768 [Cricetulus griseus]